MWFVRCGCFRSPLGCPRSVIIGVTQNLLKTVVGAIFSPPAIPLRRRHEQDGFRLFPLEVATRYPLFLLTFSDNFYCQMILKALLHWKSI